MRTLHFVNKSLLLFITAISSFAPGSALAQQLGSGTSIPNCVTDVGDAMTDAVQNVAASTASIISQAGGANQPVLLKTVSAASILGGAGGYSALKVERGDNSILVVAGKTSAGSTKGYFGPAGIYYYAPKDKFDFGVGQNGIAVSSSPTTGVVDGAGDLALNSVYTVYQCKSSKYAVAAMINANVNLGHDTYKKGLTSHSGIAPAALLAYTPRDNNTINLGVARAIPLGSSDPQTTQSNVEYDHQFSKPRLKSFIGSVGFQTANSSTIGTLTPFTILQYTRASNQFSAGYTHDAVVATGTDRTAGYTFGFVHTFKNKYDPN